MSRCVSADAQTAGPGGSLPAHSEVDWYTRNAPTGSMHDSAIVPTGGSQAHNNMQPYLVINFCIALQGIFPSQN